MNRLEPENDFVCCSWCGQRVELPEAAEGSFLCPNPLCKGEISYRRKTVGPTSTPYLKQEVIRPENQDLIRLIETIDRFLRAADFTWQTFQKSVLSPLGREIEKENEKPDLCRRN